MPTFITESKLSLVSTATWETYNLSALIPANAVVVFLKFKNTLGFSYRITARSADSTDVLHLTPSMRDVGLAWQACKVNSSRQISVWRDQASSQVHIFGYLTADEVAADTNIITKFASVAAGSWTTVNLTSLIPSGTSQVFGALIHVNAAPTLGAADAWGVRPVGSTNSIIQFQNQAVSGLVAVPLNANNEIEVFWSDGIWSPPRFYTVAFLKKKVLFYHTSPINVTPTSTSSVFEDKSILPDKAIAGIYDVTTTGRQSYNITGKGIAVTAPQGNAENRMAVGIVPKGTSNIVQTLRSSAGVTIRELGYWTSGEPSNQLFNGVNF